MTGVWWGTRAGLLNGIILTSLSRNFFTDLRKTSVDMPKPQFVRSISQSANDFFSSFFILKKILGKGPQCDGQRSLSYLVLTCSVDFFMLSPFICLHLWARSRPGSTLSFHEQTWRGNNRYWQRAQCDELRKLLRPLLKKHQWIHFVLETEHTLTIESQNGPSYWISEGNGCIAWSRDPIYNQDTDHVSCKALRHVLCFLPSYSPSS